MIRKANKGSDKQTEDIIGRHRTIQEDSGSERKTVDQHRKTVDQKVRQWTRKEDSGPEQED
jgi:hypothetical protein